MQHEVTLDELVYTLDDHLANAGDTVDISGHTVDDHFETADRSFELPQGVNYDLVLTHAGDGILVTGLARAVLAGSCDRCLDDAQLELAAEVDEYYLFHEPDATRSDDDFDFSLVSADKTLDLGSAIASALVMEIPFVVLCQEDCKGLCPDCGANLNHEDCGHAQERAKREEQDRLASNPFAKLRDLTFDA